MKKLLLLAQLFLGSLGLYAQNIGAIRLSDLPVLGISRSVSLHFLSPEKISYVDLSSHYLKGDLPEKNILRVKIVTDSSGTSCGEDGGTVTIVGETFICQYRLTVLADSDRSFISSQVEILPQQMRPLDVSGKTLSTVELRANALSLLKKREGSVIRSVSGFGVSVSLNRVYTLGEFVLLDLGFSNSTNLPFEVDELRFTIEDKKINKATSVQSLELFPVFQLYGFEKFRRTYRNIYVLKKATFPGDKVLSISLSEKQVSGRNLKLSLKYADILGADTI